MSNITMRPMTVYSMNKILGITPPLPRQSEEEDDNLSTIACSDSLPTLFSDNEDDLSPPEMTFNHAGTSMPVIDIWEELNPIKPTPPSPQPTPLDGLLLDLFAAEELGLDIEDTPTVMSINDLPVLSTPPSSAPSSEPSSPESERRQRPPSPLIFDNMTPPEIELKKTIEKKNKKTREYKKRKPRGAYGVKPHVYILGKMEGNELKFRDAYNNIRKIKSKYGEQIYLVHNPWYSDKWMSKQQKHRRIKDNLVALAKSQMIYPIDGWRDCPHATMDYVHAADMGLEQFVPELAILAAAKDAFSNIQLPNSNL